VVEEALRLLEERDRDRQARLEELRHQIALGLEQLDRGNSRPFDEEAVKRVIARGRQRLAEEQERSE
jgi:antitoxin ParD1/3/4